MRLDHADWRICLKIGKSLSLEGVSGEWKNKFC